MDEHGTKSSPSPGGNDEFKVNPTKRLRKLLARRALSASTLHRVRLTTRLYLFSTHHRSKRLHNCDDSWSEHWAQNQGHNKNHDDRHHFNRCLGSLFFFLSLNAFTQSFRLHF